MKMLAGVAMAAGLILGGAAAAQPQGSTLSLALEGVRSSQGKMVAVLCGDPAQKFPEACSTYRMAVNASAGETVVTFAGVAPGRYAIAVFHDENGDGVPNIPPEGFAFGNDATYPTTFDLAAIKVAGDTRAQMTMIYPGGYSAQARPTGSHGVPPPPGVSRIDVRDNGLYGELYLPTHSKPLPAIVLFGGSEGGLDTMSGMAAGFAQHGYATLALAYWAEQGLPQSLQLIPLEYFDHAVDWLKARPEVNSRAIGAIGWSRGSEAVLLLGSRNPDVRAVVAVSPSGIVWQGLDYPNFLQSKSAWTAGGQPLPFLAPDAAAYRPNAPMKPIFDDALAKVDARPETEIPVERIHGPVLLISGRDDQLWPSTQMADRVMARLKRAKFRHDFAHLAYEGAGHVVFVGAPDSIMSRGFRGASLALGGTPEANAKAWSDDWPKVLAFYGKALKEGRQ